MRVNLNMNTQNNFSPLKNLHAASMRHEAGKSASVGVRRDKADISPMGKLAGALNELTKQKEKLTEQKNALMGKTLKKFGTLKSIEPQLAAFDELIISLEQHMKDLIAAENERALKGGDTKESTDKKPKTEEEIEAEKQTAIVSSSADIKLARAANLKKENFEGNSRITKTEAALDRNSLTLEYRVGMVSSNGLSEVLSRKEAEVVALRSKAERASKSFGKLMQNIEQKTEVASAVAEPRNAAAESAPQAESIPQVGEANAKPQGSAANGGVDGKASSEAAPEESDNNT